MGGDRQTLPVSSNEEPGLFTVWHRKQIVEMQNLIYREMETGEEEAMIALVKEAFNEFVAPNCEEAGVEEFFRFANSEALKDRIQNSGFVLAAEHERTLAGVLEFLPPNRIAIFFCNASQARYCARSAVASGREGSRVKRSAAAICCSLVPIRRAHLREDGVS